MIRYFLGWEDEKGRAVNDPKLRGKRWRPVTSLLVAEAVGGGHQAAIPFAVAIELFHNYTLIHDDVEDHDEFRRHRPTVWKVFGLEQAINAGSGLHVLAHRVAEEAHHPHTLEILQVLETAWLEVHEGQYLDMSFERRNDVTEEEYLRMNALKTGALVRAAAEAGAMAATDDKSLIAQYRAFGLELGNAYQVFDDINSVWSTSKDTGKAAAGDIRKKKKTLPFIYSLRRLSQGGRKRLLAIYSKEKVTDVDVKTVIRLFEAAGAYDFCLKLGNEFKKKTLQLLDKTGAHGQPKDDLIDLVNTITHLNN